MKLRRQILIWAVGLGLLGCFDSICEGKRGTIFDPTPVTTIFKRKADLSKVESYADLVLQAAALHGECRAVIASSSTSPDGPAVGTIKTEGWDGHIYDATSFYCYAGSCQESPY